MQNLSYMRVAMSYNKMNVFCVYLTLNDKTTTTNKTKLVKEIRNNNRDKYVCYGNAGRIDYLLIP